MARVTQGQPSNFAMERPWPFSSSSLEAEMKDRRLRAAWCCCHWTGHAAHRACWAGAALT